MNVHDETASVVSLARVTLTGLDRKAVDSTVRTATLVLLIEKLIELGAPDAISPVQESAQKAVRNVVATFEAMIEHRG